MPLNLRFAVISDPHIAHPHTIRDNPHRFNLVEVSIPAFEHVLSQLETLNLDFLLLPGDLTQHGETDNHRWLTERLTHLPFPTYVVPGNHDIIQESSTEQTLGLRDFPAYYQKFGYDNTDRLYYTRIIHPGVRLIGLNSIQFDETGQQHYRGSVDDAQLEWLRGVLSTATEDLILVMIHHNVAEHLPGQSKHRMGQRYLLENQADLLHCLGKHGVRVVFTGHLHVQDVACSHDVYDITTGSLVSYPHPYRLMRVHTDAQGHLWLEMESHRVQSLPSWPTLQTTSRQWMGDRSFSFIQRLLTEPPLELTPTEAEHWLGELRYFWADLAHGDALFDFPHLPVSLRRYFESFSATNDQGSPLCIDNHTSLKL